MTQYYWHSWWSFLLNWNMSYSSIWNGPNEHLRLFCDCRSAFGILRDKITSITRLYRLDHSDCIALHEDLSRLADCEQTWGMKFHPQKYSILSVTRPRSPIRYSYQLKRQTLKLQDTSKYLGVDLQSPLVWKTESTELLKELTVVRLAFSVATLVHQHRDQDKRTLQITSAWLDLIWNIVRHCGNPTKKNVQT